MPGEPPITTIGTLLRQAEGITFVARLPIGAEVRAFPSKALARTGVPLHPGDRVRLELTPYDFSKARIVARIDGDPGTPEPNPLDR